MDNVLTEHLSKASASSESNLVKDIVKDNLFNYTIDLENVINKTKQLETDLDVIDNTTTKKTNLDHIKSNSDPSINLNNKETVIDKSNKLIDNKTSNKSINKSIEKLITNSNSDKPIQFTNQQPIQKKLLRGISRATDNIELTSKLRSIFAYDFQAIKDNDSFKDNLNLDLNLPKYTFTLPDISIHPDDFRQFLEKDLIEKSTLTSLKQSKRLNWWNSDELNIAQKLWPIMTSGDGNCLLHACSLGLFGFHDRLLTLRKALHYYLINAGSSNESSFYKRWRYQTTLENKKAGLILCEEEWMNDWQNLLKMASSEPRVHGHVTKTTKTIELNGGKKKEICEEVSNHVYESLESFHLFALANLLKRSIVVIADKTLKDVSGQDFAPIPFGGIYLPLKCDPKECNKTPLCLTYDAAHFSSLVAMDRESYADKTPLEPAIIPLVDFENILLPIQFVIEPPTDLKWNKDEYDDDVIEKLSISERDKIELLDKYLDLVYVNKNTKEIYSSEEFKKKQNQDKEIKLKEQPCQLKSITIELTETDQNNQTETKKIQHHQQSNTGTTESEKKRKFYFGSLSSLTVKFSSLKRSLSKKFRRNLNVVNSNINSFARSSFRLSRRISRLSKNESQTKSANNLDSTTLSTNSLIENKSSPSRSSIKSSINKSPSKLSNKQQSPVKSIDKIEESIPNDFILAADMHISNKPQYRDQLIHNYLVSARLRFLNETKNNNLIVQKTMTTNPIDDQMSNKDSIESNVSSNNSLVKDDDFVNQCVNTGCENFGKSSTNYLCDVCFINQKKELIEIRNNETTIKTES